MNGFRQERLAQLAEKFERKAALRESWLSDMITVLSDQNFGNNTSQVEAALKKHEAISSDIEARVSSSALAPCFRYRMKQDIAQQQASTVASVRTGDVQSDTDSGSPPAIFWALCSVSRHGSESF